MNRNSKYYNQSVNWLSDNSWRRHVVKKMLVLLGGLILWRLYYCRSHWLQVELSRCLFRSLIGWIIWKWLSSSGDIHYGCKSQAVAEHKQACGTQLAADNRRGEAWEFSRVERDARLYVRALFRSRWRTRRLIGVSRDERRKDGGWGSRAAVRSGRGVGMQSPPLDAQHSSRRLIVKVLTATRHHIHTYT